MSVWQPSSPIVLYQVLFASVICCIDFMLNMWEKCGYPDTCSVNLFHSIIGYVEIDKANI